MPTAGIVAVAVQNAVDASFCSKLRTHARLVRTNGKAGRAAETDSVL